MSRYLVQYIAQRRSIYGLFCSRRLGFAHFFPERIFVLPFRENNENSSKTHNDVVRNNNKQLTQRIKK